MKQLKHAWIGLLVFTACNSNAPTAEDSMHQEFAMASKDSAALGISEKVVEDFIHAIPSPLELSSMILNTGAPYNSHFLSDAGNATEYSDASKKALNMGRLGVDLGYLYMYDKTLTSIDYVIKIRQLASQLKVSQFFDFDAIKSLSKSNKNVDTLINMTARSFLKMNDYLREQKRGHISVLLVTGTWIEGEYLSTQIALLKENKALEERIGEQKEILDNLLLMLEVFKKDPIFKLQIDKLQNLKKLYDGVSITYTYAKPKAKNVNGELVIEDNSNSVVNISHEQVKEIAAAVAKVRNEMIQ